MIDSAHLMTAHDAAIAQMTEAEQRGWSAFTAAAWWSEAQTLRRFMTTADIHTTETP